MYLREKRRREREQRAREHAEAVTAQFRERVSALENELRNREQAAALNTQLQEHAPRMPIPSGIHETGRGENRNRGAIPGSGTL